ncbi:phosphopyruvate hydratase [Kushneria phyllosphaerae]|uniref:Enolase n=1 Tax=Kushneria phyllosphaerae TaxID=2100822 RepID=A0A2R8CHS5_9GAMM|nr:phosphopyruvate hydratase [Kushneria phyllosphaerae]SPJ32465.1 Enolase 2 [Kushneria phyllosphaerae]
MSAQPSCNIVSISAIEVLDSRGNPTVEACVVLNDGTSGRAIVPSGASTGNREAVELRDGDLGRYQGRGVLKAVANINDLIAPVLIGRPADEQRRLDHLMCELDGTDNKSRLGANAILAVSMALTRAAASHYRQPLYRYLGGSNAHLLPVPCLNVINGGQHASNNLDFQEFKIVPHHAPSFAEAIRMGEETFHALKTLLAERGLGTGIGDEGGFAPALKSNEQAVELILDAIEAAGYRPGEDISLALDPATSEMAEGDGYRFSRSDNVLRTADEMTDLWQSWLDRYPIILLEDPLGEDDWAGWETLTRRLAGRVELVGDDLLCTNPELLQRAIDQGVANSVLIKPNQIGTVTETLECVTLANRHGYGCYLSHRSGESEDTFIADLAVAIGCGHMKTGSGCRSERVAKFNQLLRIENELGYQARFAGRDAFRTRRA